ncbi:MAG: hypothetical protein NC420_03135 [Eubacterium sp.]|nr:hypothetical protein [Eubacterium sp.]
MEEANNEQLNEYQCHTPVVFIFFNRPKLMQQVLEQIAKVRPPKLYLVADGPRDEIDREKTETCRKIADHSIDWDCEVIKLYSEVNLGCCNRIYSGISYALNREECVIVLEDDIVPSVSFFRFQDEMLEKYRDEEKVFSVSGFNRLDYLPYEGASYYFVQQHFACWGWGTWARAWKPIDIDMKAWNEIKGHPKRMKLYNVDPKLAKQTYRGLQKVYLGITDSWARRVSFWQAEHELYSVMPRYSLTQNIGFGADATHTIRTMQESIVQAHEIEFPLVVPQNITRNEAWTMEWVKDSHKYYYRRMFIGYGKEFLNRAFRILLRKEAKIYKTQNGYRIRLKEYTVRKPDHMLIEEILKG